MGQALADDTANRGSSPTAIINAMRLTGVIAELELGKIAVQMLLAASPKSPASRCVPAKVVLSSSNDTGTRTVGVRAPD